MCYQMARQEGGVGPAPKCGRGGGPYNLIQTHVSKRIKKNNKSIYIYVTPICWAHITFVSAQ